MRALATIVGLAVTLSAALGRSEGLVTGPLTPVEASGRWAALLIRLASRSRHRRDSTMSQRYPFIDAYLA